MLLERFHHLLTGEVTVRIEGDEARFMTLATRQGIPLWGFAHREGAALFSCRPGDYRRLRPLARRSGARLKLAGKRGLPFRALPLRKRLGLLIGLPIAVGIFWFLSGFVWGVSVTGSETLGDGLVLEAARQNGVALGSPRDSFVPKIAAHGLVGDLPELEWAAVNTNGCFVEIAVQEGAAAPEVADDRRWSNIVAAREGMIVAIEAEHGRPEVTIGDIVEAGDLLIAGLYWEKLDPWSPQPAPLRTLGAARGRVLAQTYREFTVHVSSRRKEWVPTGERRVNTTLELFGLRIPLGFRFPAEGETRSFTTVEPLNALGVVLPISVERETVELLEEETRELTEEELRDLALWKLRQAQKREIREGGWVDSEELDWVFPDGMCLLTARSRCVEEIGEVREILVNSTDESDNF